MGCCFSTAKWRRTEVVDHKWDYVDLNEFKDRSIFASLGYSFVFAVTFRSVLMYMADISTAILITKFNTWSIVSPDDLAKNSKLTTFLGLSPQTFKNISPYISIIYLGSIIVSFLLLALDTRQSMRIIKSRDISFAFTDVIAYRYYCLHSFPHWCFFQAIRARHSLSAQVAFFVFFRLKDWKRLLFAETPRHLVNLLFLSYHVLTVGATDRDTWSFTQFRAKQFGDDDIRTTLTSQMGVLVMAFVFTMYAMNVISTIIAGFLYIPLLCKIRGNLKEYVCHMIDKRIAELMRHKATKRINKQQQELAMYGTTKETALAGGPEAKLPVLTEYSNVVPNHSGSGIAPPSANPFTLSSPFASPVPGPIDLPRYGSDGRFSTSTHMTAPATSNANAPYYPLPDGQPGVFLQHTGQSTASSSPYYSTGGYNSPHPAAGYPVSPTFAPGTRPYAGSGLRSQATGSSGEFSTRGSAIHPYGGHY